MVEFVLISLALISGILAFFGPCGIAMLPAYVSYLLGLDNKKSNTTSKYILKGLFFGMTATFGIISVYLFVGTIFSLGASFLKPIVPLIGFVLGIILILLGTIVYFEKFPYLPVLHLKYAKNPKQHSFKSLYLFGAGYGIAQLSCTLPIFLLVVSYAIATGSLFDGMFIFLTYGVGIGIGMVVVTIGSIVSKEALQKYISFIIPNIRKITALILIAAGLYQIYFQIAINGLFVP